MYIPKHFLQEDKIQIVNFMKQYSFATIVSSQNNLPVATHLPFVVSLRDNDIYLVSHFARANKQWEEIEKQNSLIIFAEPHAYISTKHYEKALNVPTWNYAAIHAYGNVKLILNNDEVLRILEETIQYYDTDYLNKWNSLPHKFREEMLNGIMAFELKVTMLQAKYKLSQNRMETEKKSIIDYLKQREKSTEKSVGEMMESLYSFNRVSESDPNEH